MLRVQRVLEEWGRNIVKQSRANLTRQGKRASNGLYRSLKSKVDFGNEKKITITGADYLDFVDQGVSGKRKKYNTPFSFKNKMPPREPIKDWIKTKKLFLRDEKGRFKKGGINSLSFLIQRSIFNKGLRPSLFFTRAMETSEKTYLPRLIQAYLDDLDDDIDNIDN